MSVFLIVNIVELIEEAKKEKMLSNRELLKIIKLLIEEGFKAVQLTEGETTLRQGYISSAKEINNISGIKN